VAGDCRFEGAIELEAVVDFVEKFDRGQLVPILKSEPVPHSPAAPGGIVTVVGQTFDKLVVQSEAWVLLQVYAPWCGHCKLLEPIWEELARARAQDPRVVVAKIDGTANEHLRLTFVGFPSVQLWAPGGRRVTAYKAHRTFKDLSAFLDKMVGPVPTADADAAAAGVASMDGHAEL
jgi:protein disulfide-isomerase-like protein